METLAIQDSLWLHEDGTGCFQFFDELDKYGYPNVRHPHYASKYLYFQPTQHPGVCFASRVYVFKEGETPLLEQKLKFLENGNPNTNVADMLQPRKTILFFFQGKWGTEEDLIKAVEQSDRRYDPTEKKWYRFFDEVDDEGFAPRSHNRKDEVHFFAQGFDWMIRSSCFETWEDESMNDAWKVEICFFDKFEEKKMPGVISLPPRVAAFQGKIIVMIDDVWSTMDTLRQKAANFVALAQELGPEKITQDPKCVVTDRDRAICGIYYYCLNPKTVLCDCNRPARIRKNHDKDRSEASCDFHVCSFRTILQPRSIELTEKTFI